MSRRIAMHQPGLEPGCSAFKADPLTDYGTGARCLSIRRAPKATSDYQVRLSVTACSSACPLRYGWDSAAAAGRRLLAGNRFEDRVGRVGILALGALDVFVPLEHPQVVDDFAQRRAEPAGQIRRPGRVRPHRAEIGTRSMCQRILASAKSTFLLSKPNVRDRTVVWPDCLQSIIARRRTFRTTIALLNDPLTGEQQSERSDVIQSDREPGRRRFRFAGAYFGPRRGRLTCVVRVAFAPEATFAPRTAKRSFPLTRCETSSTAKVLLVLVSTLSLCGLTWRLWCPRPEARATVGARDQFQAGELEPVERAGPGKGDLDFPGRGADRDAVDLALALLQLVDELLRRRLAGQRRADTVHHRLQLARVFEREVFATGVGGDLLQPLAVFGGDVAEPDHVGRHRVREVGFVVGADVVAAVGEEDPRVGGRVVGVGPGEGAVVVGGAVVGVDLVRRAPPSSPLRWPLGSGGKTVPAGGMPMNSRPEPNSTAPSWVDSPSVLISRSRPCTRSRFGSVTAIEPESSRSPRCPSRSCTISRRRSAWRSGPSGPERGGRTKATDARCASRSLSRSGIPASRS